MRTSPARCSLQATLRARLVVLTPAPLPPCRSRGNVFSDNTLSDVESVSYVWLDGSDSGAPNYPDTHGNNPIDLCVACARS